MMQRPEGEGCARRECLNRMDSDFQRYAFVIRSHQETLPKSEVSDICCCVVLAACHTL
jgi:hypothetical protein